MRIHTFFDCSPRLSNQGELIRLWRDSWQNRGWECKILNPRTYVGHKLLPEFRRATRLMGSAEKARLSRWLALDAVGGGWICHYDVINFGPVGFFPVFNKQWKSVVFDTEFSYAHLTKADCNRVVRHIIDGAPNEARAFYDTYAPVDTYQTHHTQFGDPGWHNGHTVHFGMRGIKMFIDDESQSPKFRMVETCGRPI